MSTKFKAAVVILVLAQLALLLALIGVKEYRLHTGTTVILQTIPVDPRSLMQGDYAILNYQISIPPDWIGSRSQGTSVYVTLLEGDDVWTASSKYYYFEKPSADNVFIKGKVDARGQLDFGIGTFFVPEGTGQIIEGSRDVKVKVSVTGSGNATIRDVIIDGKPFRSHLSER